MMLGSAKNSLMFWSACLISAMMIFPCIIASIETDWPVARSFFYHGVFFMILIFIFALAGGPFFRVRTHFDYLVETVIIIALLPVIAAFPVASVMSEGDFFAYYFELLSSFTTTGLSTVFASPETSFTIRFWLALVSWVGGYFFIFVAFTLLRPIGIGESGVGTSIGYVEATKSFGADPNPSHAARFRRFNKRALISYFGFTAMLFIGLIGVKTPLDEAALIALSTIATSGYFLPNGFDGFAQEFLVLLFLSISLSHHFLGIHSTRKTYVDLLNDPEMRAGLFLILCFSGLLLFQSLTSSPESIDQHFGAYLREIWASLFMATSFLTTHGVASEYWSEGAMQSTPILIFVTLALIGGGIATSSGGLRLNRVRYLYEFSIREVKHVIIPSAILHRKANGGQDDRWASLRLWCVVMFFFGSFLLLAGLLALSGLSFDNAFRYAVASLTTTGPLAELGAAAPEALDFWTKIVISIGMILGRLEVLVVFAVVLHLVHFGARSLDHIR